MSTALRPSGTIIPRGIVASGSLAANDRASRISMALGTTFGTLPNVDSKTLRKFYECLAENLSFPFVAECHGQVGLSGERIRTVLVVDLIDPLKNIKDDFGGIYCKARIDGGALDLPLAELEVPEDDANFWLIEDYWYWFWNWR